MDFLVKHSGVLNARDGTLALENFDFKCMRESEYGSQVCRVVLEETVVVPSRCEMMLPGTVKGLACSTHAIVEGTPKVLQQKHLVVAKTIVDPSCETVPLRVINVTDNPITLYEGTNVATCNPVDNVFKASRSSEGVSERVFVATPGGCGSIPKHLNDLWGDVAQRLSGDQRGEVEQLLAEFQGIFAKSKSDLGRTDLVQHGIKTGDAVPIKQHPRRIPLALRPEAEAEVQRMADLGIIEPSDSPWDHQWCSSEKRMGLSDSV